MKPTIGRIVHYRVSAEDVKHFLVAGYAGNVRAGTVLPAVVTAVFGERCVNLKVFGDCVGDAWITSRNLATDEQLEAGTNGVWFWPPRE